MVDLKKYSWVNHLVKVLIVSLLCYTLYQKIWLRDDLETVWDTFWEGMSADHWYLAVLTLGLLPLNLLVEALKWQVLMRPFRQLSIAAALRGILAGITLALFTPNRLGEYGGRVLLVDAKDNWSALISTGIGNLCQLIILLSTGIGGCLFMCKLYFPAMILEARLLTFFVLLLLLGMVVALFHLDKMGTWLDKRLSGRDWIQKLIDQGTLLRQYDRTTLFYGLGLAGLRYLVYTTQYYLLLLFFGIMVPPEAAYAGIATIFFIQTGLPLPPLMGLLARGEIALLVWSNFSANEFSILAATFSLFIINLAGPALLGMILVVKINVLKSLGYAKNPD